MLEHRDSHQCKCDKRMLQNVSVRDVILVYSNAQIRGLWKLKKLERLIESSHVKVRAVYVKVSTRKKKSALLRHPIQHLYHLEINCTSDKGRAKDEQHSLLKVEDRPQQGSEDELYVICLKRRSAREARV